MNSDGTSQASGPTNDEYRPLSRGDFLRGSLAATLVLAGASPAASFAVAAPRNVRVSRDVFAIHAEPFLAANPSQPGQLLGACIAEDSSGWLSTYSSDDHGASWRSNGRLAGSVNGRDPSVAFTAAGEGFVCGNTDGGGVSVWRTHDGGRSFSVPVRVRTGGRADHPWLAADRSTGPGAKNLYAVWTVDGNTKLGFARSADAGRSFESPRTIAKAARNGIVASPMLAAGKDGLVCAIVGLWPESAVAGAGPKGSARRRPEIVAPVAVVCSTDHGRTFGRLIRLGLGAMELHLPGTAASVNNPKLQAFGDASAISLPTIAADWASGALYAAFVVRPTSAKHSIIVLSASRDRGRTWAQPVRITPAQQGRYYFQPQLAVSDSGRIGCSAFVYERRRVHVVLSTSAGGSLRFAAPRRVSDRTFDPARGGLPGGSKHGAWWIGDYQGLAVAGDVFHPFWNDTRTGSLELFTTSTRG